MHADVWGKVWAAAEDLGGSIQVIKVQGHGKIEIGMSSHDKLLVSGNGYADVLAKKGVELHDFDVEQLQVIKRAYKNVVSVAKFLVSICSRHKFRDEQDEKLPRIIGSKGLNNWKEGSHVVFWHEKASTFRCVVCLRSSTGGLHGSCSGPTAHTVYQYGPYVYCGKCGAYSRHRVSRLLDPCCPGRPSSIHFEGALAAFRAGLDPEGNDIEGRPYPLSSHCWATAKEPPAQVQS